MSRFILLFITILFFSCNSAPEKKENNYTPKQVSEKKELIEDVMAIHDEAMAWIDEINTLKTNIQQVANSDSLVDVDNGISAQLLEQSILELESADEAMMDWMRNYSEPKDTVSFENAITYLSNEKKAISKVRTQMKTAMENANQVLQK